MNGALAVGLSLVFVGAAAWAVATYVSCYGPLPAGRRIARALRAMLGASAVSVMLLAVGVTLLVVGAAA